MHHSSVIDYLCQEDFLVVGTRFSGRCGSGEVVNVEMVKIRANV